MRPSMLCAVLLASLALPVGAEEDNKKEEEKWDVDNPPGPHSSIEIDTDQGTWLSVDVSPDGEEIAFDLLGDIYRIPIGGGEAEALTSGVAWDMQPRYSPDGKSIAFTSDRGGGDNIWVMARDGTGPKAVTEEKFRLLNSPVWTPDGEYLIAHKHFTSTRSLGAGEMWLYHRSGGGGVQLTEKPNDQKDAGEPAVSPDGRYVYYSQDTTPGRSFQYNKDSNTQIYVIQRLDRESGETQEYISGPGGSVRPTPSPDGKSIAFVRRIRFQSVLFVRDLESGLETPIYHALDRDMQETWAIHGVYPSIAWTPDSGSIVFWAGGKIHRIDVASREVAAIPFHVKATRQITAALRYPVEVAPDRFPVRMLRWVQVSPSGDRVVYQALGHLYVRGLPSGTPKRLTSQSDHFEHYPSWSRDGRQIVYTTWDDDELGSVRIVSAGGGEGRIVTDSKGHYLEPVFSPDGSTIVYRRAASPGFIRSPLYSSDPGLYRVAAEGGASKLVTRDGTGPHFGASPNRVFVLRREEEEDKRALVSIDLDGSDERAHLGSVKATEYQVSPDGKWVAFAFGFKAYVSPFPATGKRIEIGPKSEGLPVQKVSAQSGEYLHWSGDSARLHWSLGPELYTRDLKDAFDFMPGAPEELPDPPESGTPIGFTADADVPSGRVALIGGRVITMRGDEVIEDAVVVIERNRITAVGPKASTTIPSDAETIDVSGHTVIPGLVDVHWHGAIGTQEFVPERNWMLYAGLAFGVTTAHDPSNDTSTIFAGAEMAKAGRVVSPRIFSTGTILYGATTAFTAEIDSLDDARFHLGRMKAVGAITVKSYNQPRREQRQQVIAAAREMKMMVVPEGGSLYQYNMTMVVDGHTGVQHSIPVGAIYEDTLQLWGGSEVGYTPTVGVGYGGLNGESYWYAKTNVWENERLMEFVPRRIVDSVARRRTLAPDEEWNHMNIVRIAKELTDVGVSVQIGAHGQREGLAAHWELWSLAQGGMTPLEVIRAGTLNGAEYLGLDGDIGSIEVGKLADLAVIGGNPLEDIRETERVRYVVLNGRVYDAANMNEIGNHPRKRGTFFWEDMEGER